MTDRYNDFTDKNTRHCVDSVSTRFYDAGQEPPPTFSVEDE